MIFSRFDQMYTDYHIKGYENKIIIPEGEDYFGLMIDILYYLRD